MRYSIDLVAQSPDPITNVVSVIPNANVNVFVRNADGTSGAAATVFKFADPGNSTPLTQPFLSDAAGRIPGWLAAGDYNIQIMQAGFTTQVTAYSVGAGGGGTPPGMLKVVSFTFHHNTPNLNTGVDIGYTPNVGDVLYDAWFTIATAWDAPAWGDFCTYIDGTAMGIGFFSNGPGFNPDMTQVDGFASNNNGLRIMGQAASLQQLSSFDAAWHDVKVGSSPNLTYVHTNPSPNAPSPPPIAPGAPDYWNLSNPVKVCVSSDGSNTGSTPAATVGTATLWLMVCTPIIL